MGVVVVVDSDKFDEYIEMRDEVQTLLNEAYDKANILKNTMENEKEWCGEAYEKFRVYMELIIKYQELFTDNNANNPLQISRDADIALRDRVADFKENFPEYKALEE